MTLKPKIDPAAEKMRRNSTLDKVTARLVTAATDHRVEPATDPDSGRGSAEIHNSAGSLNSALDAIVAKWSVGPARDVPVRAGNRPTTRVASQRLSALRKALRALTALHADVIYPAVAISLAYPDPRRRGNRGDERDPVQIEDVMVALQQIIEAYKTVGRSIGRAGRPTDHYRRALTKEVARVCHAYGVKFSDNPAGPAAAALEYVFARVPGAFHLGPEGLRPYLRLGREEQGRRVG